MSHPILRLHDGFEGTSPELRDEVKELQRLLNQDGFQLTVDGLFGRDTETAVKRFQRDQGIDDDGIVGPLTWGALLGTEPSYTTTFPPDHPGLLAELAQARKYKEVVNAAATAVAVPAYVLAGIGSRESGWGLRLKPRGPAGTGDFIPRRFPTRFRTGPLPPDGGGFGRGIMQIDYDAHPFARTGAWRRAKANIEYGARVLGGNRDFLKNKTNLTPEPLLRASIAAYNCGAGNVLRAIRDSRDLDYYTAGRNYSADVLNRGGWFGGQGWEGGET